VRAETHAFCDRRVNLLFDINDLRRHCEETNSVISNELERLRKKLPDALVVICHKK
jgi:hypothetical protein